MKPTTFIWRLIHALSQKEREWFYRTAEIGQTPERPSSQFLYVELFRAILAQDVYDEKALKIAFKDSHFPELKNRLKQAIYRAVLFYRHTPDQVRNQATAQIDWLIEKGFYHEASKQLRRAKKKAISEEAFLTQLALLNLENELLLQDDSIKSSLEIIDALEHERIAILEKYSNLQAFIGFYRSIHTKIKKQFTPQGKFTASHISQIEGHDLMQSKNRALSKRALLYYLRLQYIAVYLSGDFAGSLSIVEEVTTTYESHDFLIAEFPNDYFKRKHHLAASLMELGKIDTGQKHLEIFYSKRNVDPLHFDYYYSGLLNRSLLIQQYDEIVAVAPAIDRGLKQFHDRLSLERKYILWLSLGRIYYRLNNWKKSEKYYRKIIEAPKLNYRVDIQGSARIMMVLLQFQMEDYAGMEYYIRMASQFLYRRKTIFPFERALLNFFRLCLREPSSTERLQALQELHSHKEELLSNDSSLRAFHFFDFESWIDTTITILKM